MMDNGPSYYLKSARRHQISNTMCTSRSAYMQHAPHVPSDLGNTKHVPCQSIPTARTIRFGSSIELHLLAPEYIWVIPIKWPCCWSWILTSSDGERRRED